MSPEQARGQTSDHRTDVWAFGCVLYEMLAGRPAFGRPTVSDTIVAVLDRDPDWAPLPATTPRHVQILLRHCLEKDMRRRRRDMGDIALELEAGGASTGTAGQDVTSTAARPDQERAAPQFVMATLIAAATIGAAGWAWSVGHGSRTDGTEVVEFAIYPPPGTHVS
jgi:serine/threonine protein kinase